MISASYHFPKGFLWGAATAGHQVEGQSKDSWSAWEDAPGRILNGQKAGLACDWWGGRWQEDFDRAAQTGQNAHRLSIEWSRIEPEPGRWDNEALDRYREMIAGALKRGLTPMVTLHHFANPLWMEESGSWEREDSPELFERYVCRVVEALKEDVNLWITINEPNVYMLCAYLEGVFPPGKRDLTAAINVYANLARAHARAYHAIHRIQPQARVSIANHFRAVRPETASPLDSLAANLMQRAFNDSFPGALRSGVLDLGFKRISIPEAANTQDFIGLNYYTLDQVRFNLLKSRDFFQTRRFPPSAEVSDTGFIANVPEGLWLALKWANRYQKPIIISENGVEDADDDLRPRYLIQHIHQIWRGVNFSWPIKGYFHWSLVDNFEWERGWSQRFGLWGLDVETQARVRRRSVDVYEAVCRENSITSEMVEQFAPEIFKKVFPA